MAQLKDLLVNGPATFLTKINGNILNADNATNIQITSVPTSGLTANYYCPFVSSNETSMQSLKISSPLTFSYNTNSSTIKFNIGDSSSQGKLALYSGTGCSGIIQTDNLIDDQEYILPKADGYLAVGNENGVGDIKTPIYMDSNGELQPITPILTPTDGTELNNINNEAITNFAESHNIDINEDPQVQSWMNKGLLTFKGYTMAGTIYDYQVVNSHQEIEFPLDLGFIEYTYDINNNELQSKLIIGGDARDNNQLKTNGLIRLGTTYNYDNRNYREYSTIQPNPTNSVVLTCPSSSGTIAVGNSSGVGSNIQPIYMNSKGELLACSYGVGSSTQPIYMNSNGILQPCDNKFLAQKETNFSLINSSYTFTANTWYRIGYLKLNSSSKIGAGFFILKGKRNQYADHNMLSIYSYTLDCYHGTIALLNTAKNSFFSKIRLVYKENYQIYIDVYFSNNSTYKLDSLKAIYFGDPNVSFEACTSITTPNETDSEERMRIDIQ